MPTGRPFRFERKIIKSERPGKHMGPFAKWRAVIGEMKNAGMLRPEVIEAVKTIAEKRHLFADMPKELAEYDNPMGIGEGQTTSQVSLIAYKLNMSGLKKGESMLEVGSGHNILLAMAHLITGKPVHGVEIRKKLIEKGQKILEEMGHSKEYVKQNYTIEEVKAGHEHLAHKGKGFDVIIVSAGLGRGEEKIDDFIRNNQKLRNLLARLNDGGRLLIPMGRGGISTGVVVGPIYFFRKSGNTIEWMPLPIKTAYVPLG